ncbi:MAG: hypothetical protein BJ554DRAFT_4564 [Olpidium bornovanus]|uniref:Uncharacterized protein n=1 Tax=Olpidium bornovanus TaxID=278681 RepID=A0A8H7ZMH2_9FUNG|nr:MAG: hypothetical protein BJ554DRAFT_4564 [Olpidium bornovanus]
MLLAVFMFVQRFDEDGAGEPFEFETWRDHISRTFVASAPTSGRPVDRHHLRDYEEDGEEDETEVDGEDGDDVGSTGESGDDGGDGDDDDDNGDSGEEEEEEEGEVEEYDDGEGEGYVGYTGVLDRLYARGLADPYYEFDGGGDQQNDGDGRLLPLADAVYSSSSGGEEQVRPALASFSSAGEAASESEAEHPDYDYDDDGSDGSGSDGAALGSRRPSSLLSAGEVESGEDDDPVERAAFWSGWW